MLHPVGDEKGLMVEKKGWIGVLSTPALRRTGEIIL